VKHQQAKPPRINRKDLPDGLQAILTKLLAKRPADRYQTAAELAQALTDLLSKETPSGFTWPGTGPQRLPRRRFPLALFAGLALAALLGLYALFFRGSSDATSTKVAGRPPGGSSGAQPSGSSGSQPTGNTPVRAGELVTNIAASTSKPYATTTAQV